MFFQLNSIYSLVYLGNYYEQYSHVKNAILKNKYDNNIFMNTKELLSKYKTSRKYFSNSKKEDTFSSIESIMIDKDKFQKYDSDDSTSYASKDSSYVIDDDDVSVLSEKDFCFM